MIRGGLFTRFFLDDGIRGLPEYARLDPDPLAEFAADVRHHWQALDEMPRPSEAETEAVFINPILAGLGSEHLPQQEPGRGRRDIADALLFLDPRTAAQARPRQSADRFRLGAVVVENEAKDRPLDRASSGGEAPAHQLLRYLGRAEAQSGGRLRWGLLSNGRLWRLYWAQARARAEGFVEIDLPSVVGASSDGGFEAPPASPPGADAHHWLRVFPLLFGRDALIPEGPERRTFLAARSTRAASTSSASLSRCRAPSSIASSPILSRRSARPPRTRVRTIQAGAPMSARRAFACSTACCSCFMPRIATCCRCGARLTAPTVCSSSGTWRPKRSMKNARCRRA